METLSEPIRERMPPDLLQYILKQETVTSVPICEQEPAPVAFETIPLGAFEMKAYFPISPSDETVVFMHLPGGKSQWITFSIIADFDRGTQERYR